MLEVEGVEAVDSKPPNLEIPVVGELEAEKNPGSESLGVLVGGLVYQ